jgi:glycosyltransferase involved in cell wall biosynthesis
LNELPPPPEGKSGWPWTEFPEPPPDTMPDGHPWPKICVVTPSFNQGQYIEETIRSVLLQGYPNLEFIIIDGGSTDKTIEIIKEYESWLAYWVSEPDRGQSHAVNKGILKSTGSVIFWINSDDVCLPGAFQKVMQIFLENPEVKIVSGQARVIDSSSVTTGTLRSYYKDWYEIVTNPGNSLRQVSTFFHRSIFDECGLLDESLNEAMDTEFLIRATEHHRPIVLNDELAAFRDHPEAKTSQFLLSGYEESDRTRNRYFYNKAVRKQYKKRSAIHWLNIAKMDGQQASEKARCLNNALANDPTMLFRSIFWITVLGFPR